MLQCFRSRVCFFALALSVGLGFAAHAETDALPSWNEGPAKRAIVDFVARVTAEGGSDYVMPAERIAVFDNDGTLWAEQPVYFQLAFAFDRIVALSPQHPDWEQTQPFKGILTGVGRAWSPRDHGGVSYRHHDRCVC
jgi:hypothetical protein